MATGPTPSPEEAFLPESQVEPALAVEAKTPIWRKAWGGVKRGWRACGTFWREVRPGPETRKGAAIGAFIAPVVVAISFGTAVHTGLGTFADIVLALILAAIIVCLAALLTWILLTIFRRLNRWATAFVIGSAVAFSMAFPTELGIPLGILAVLVTGTLGATIATLRSGWTGAARKKQVITCVLLALSVAAIGWFTWFAAHEGTEEGLVKTVAPQGPPPAALRAANPGKFGPFGTKYLTYGSGSDKWRPEYRNVAIKTPTVDGTVFMKDFKNWRAKVRKLYWGFDLDKLPLNARVWYPDGPGPFPLVLIVHGNHNMSEWSDPGYQYLGELMASRGFILASVDENFLNGYWAGGPPDEKAPRGWVLLEHLKLWREWNSKAGNPFYGKVDMDRIALMGHSRGGEAAATATLFNSLPYYPDDATVKFSGYGFKIRSVVAIAPADGQYKPAGTNRTIQNVSYFVLQGGHDSDVSIFMGSKQFDRVKFTEPGPWFKAELYIYPANHGQFNSVWGRSDWGGGPFVWFLNKKPLMPPEDQRRIASVYISAFLEATLHDRREYISLFRDVRYGREWLPGTLCLNRFEDPTMQRVADFSEDVDVTTATMPGARLGGENFSVWKEGRIPFRSGDRERNGVFLGWNRKTEKPAPVPVYTLSLPDKATASESVLTIAMSAMNEEPKVPKDAKERKQTDKEKKEKPKDADPIDFTVEMVDASGKTAAIPLSRFGALQRPLKARFTKLGFIEGKVLDKPAEPVLQTFELPVSTFAAASPGFDGSKVRTVRLKFDKVEKGEIVISEIGLRQEGGK